MDNKVLEEIKRAVMELEKKETIEDLGSLEVLKGILKEPDTPCKPVEQVGPDEEWLKNSTDRGLIIEEIKGDVIFSKDIKGNLYQQLGNDEPYKVRNGSMTYREITKVGKYTIKYNNNGIDGFAIFRGRNCLKKGYWVYEDILNMVMEM